MEMQKNVTAESVKEVWVIDIGHGSLLPPRVYRLMFDTPKARGCY